MKCFSKHLTHGFDIKLQVPSLMNKFKTHNVGGMRNQIVILSEPFQRPIMYVCIRQFSQAHNTAYNQTNAPFQIKSRLNVRYCLKRNICRTAITIKFLLAGCAQGWSPQLVKKLSECNFHHVLNKYLLKVEKKI